MTKFFVGVDEAGRGAVIGGLFIGVVMISREKEDDLLDLGLRDSKLLTLKQIRKKASA